jgi:hypothetical protein
MPRAIRFALAGVGGRHRLRGRGQREGPMVAVADRARDLFRRGRVDGARRARGSWAAGPAAGTGTYPLLAAARGRDKWRVTVRSLSSMRETLTRRPLYGDLCLARDDVDGIALGLELMAD